MPSLLDLPPELMLNVLSHFDTFWRASPDIFDVQDDRTKSLLSLCRTCHHLRNIAQPVLHEIVGVSRHTEKDALRVLSRLLETVESRPDLAKKTKTLLLKLGGLRRTSGAWSLLQNVSVKGNREPVAEDMLYSLVPHWQNVTTLELRTDDRKDDLWRAIRATQIRDEDFFPKLQSLTVRPYFGQWTLCGYTPLRCRPRRC